MPNFNFTKRQQIFMLFFVLIFVVVIDQWTKSLAVQHFAGKPAIVYLGGIFQFVYAENPGAFLGMGGGWPQSLRFVVFGLFVLLGLCAMLWSLLKHKMNLVDLLAYSFILAGGIGNVIDRLTHENGHVIDFMFMDFGFASFAKTGVFNIADVAIVIGFLFALSSMISERISSKQHTVG